MRWIATLSLAGLIIGAMFITPASAAVSWTAGGVAWPNLPASILWSNGGNWSGAASPITTDDVSFTNAGAVPFAGPPTTPTNEVDAFNASNTIHTLWYGQQDNTSPNNYVHTTVIDSALHITGNLAAPTLPDGAGFNGNYSLFAGNASALASYVSQTVIKGPGTLDVSNAGANTGGDIMVRSTATNQDAHYAILDLSGLATFNANVDQVLVGYTNQSTGGTNTTQRAAGRLYLAATNTIVANNTGTTSNVGFIVGRATGNGSSQTSYVFLGQSNTISVTNMTIGGRKAVGSMSFESGLSSPTVIIQKIGGGAATSITIGDNTENGTSSTTAIGTLDLTGSGAGTNIQATSIILGRTASAASTSSGSNATGTITFDGGTISTTTLTVALQAAASPCVATGTVTVSGTGNLAISTGGIILAQFAGAGNGTTLGSSTGTLNINGGTVTLTGGNITDGGGASTLQLSGGTLNMGGMSIGSAANQIDTLTLASGTLKNVAEINGGAAITKTTAGTLIIDGSNTYSGGTTVSAGKLLAEGSLLSFVTVNSGAILGGNGSVGGLNVQSGGTLSTGDSPGKLTANGNATLGGIDAVEINSAAAGTGYDQLVVNGASNTVALAGTLALTVSPSYTPAGDAFWIVVNNTTSSLSTSFGSVTGLPDGWNVLYNVDYDTNNLTPGSGNDVAVVAIPEPAALLMLIIAAGLGLMFRRTRDK
jgi:autotransporter-associated beta strand protein